ncbi:MAG TPA: hypothetical protein DCX54_00110 [Flavobacteriales bacterium]|nr:hypothetical protein [Flavobacteriales bacterium]
MRIKYQLISALILLLSISHLGSLKAQNYVLYQGNGAYNELNNAIVVSSDLDLMEYREKFNGHVSNDFNLKLFGLEMDTDSVIVGRQGFLLMVTKDGNHIMAIDPFVAENVTKYDTTSKISHKIEIVNGLRYYVIQWKNIQTSDAAGKYINLQLWLEEGGENVKFHFGPTDVPELATSQNGIQCGVYQLSPTFQVEKFTNLTGTAENPDPSSAKYGKLSTFPQNEMIYTFATGNPTSLDEIHLSPVVSIFPNPVSEFLILTVSESEIGMPISIKSFNGQEVFTGKIKATKTEIDFSQQTNGLYFVRIGNEYVQGVYKVMKQ